MNPMSFTELAAKEIPTFCGIKYTDAGTSYNLSSLQRVGPGLEFPVRVPPWILDWERNP